MVTYSEKFDFIMEFAMTYVSMSQIDETMQLVD